ncbi:hypothetical protein ABIE26_001341 [Pedobacter africanus]|uniref:Uncharacterized protein n=1 Tax=Pedobacter africanus TaxID=151894 RepID=A0ACC6KS42_9SPHI|nr:DUF5017 domain-containing protein [Pedobacter africanus]MDR6782170.1 hypothetical protein [Pedobacter africanus]
MKLKYITLVLCLGIFVSCKKEAAISEPDFNVTGYKLIITLDTLGNEVKQVTFDFSGDAAVVSFYPGILGNDYAYREGRILDVKALLSSFSTTLNNGTQDNQLTVMASSDFNGTYDINSIHAASWTDITSRYILNVRDASASLPSGTVNIADLLADGKPLYFAFRYICKPQSTNGVNSTWRIRAFSMQSQTDLGTATLATLTTADWKLVNYGTIVDANRGAVIESSGAIRFNGNHMNTNIQTESWAVSKAFQIDKTDMGPDRPIAIKSTINPRLGSYSFNYSNPGTYKVAFVASNANYEGQTSVVREIEVTVP